MRGRRAAPRDGCPDKALRTPGGRDSHPGPVTQASPESGQAWPVAAPPGANGMHRVPKASTSQTAAHAMGPAQCRKCRNALQALHGGRRQRIPAGHGSAARPHAPGTAVPGRASPPVARWRNGDQPTSRRSDHGLHERRVDQPGRGGWCGDDRHMADAVAQLRFGVGQAGPCESAQRRTVFGTSFAVGQMSFRYTALPPVPVPSGSLFKSTSSEPASA